jgi:hypothetical protein
MRTTILLCTLLILTGCSTAPQPEAQKAPPPGGVHFLQTDSPIIITDGGSIHFKKHNGVTAIHRQHLQVKIDTSQPWSLRVKDCDGVPNDCKTPLGAGPWTVNFFDAQGTQVATVTLPSSATDTVEIVPSGPASTFSYNKDSPSDGPDFSQSGYNLDHATVTGLSNQFKCPAGSNPTTNPCEMRIHTPNKP